MYILNEDGDVIERARTNMRLEFAGTLNHTEFCWYSPDDGDTIIVYCVKKICNFEPAFERNFEVADLIHG